MDRLTVERVLLDGPIDRWNSCGIWPIDRWASFACFGRLTVELVAVVLRVWAVLPVRPWRLNH